MLNYYVYSTELAQQHKDKKAAAQKAENERKAAEGKARSAAAKEAKEKAKEGAATDGEAARQPPPSKETEEQEEQEEGEAVVLDVKPWDDETDLVAMEAAVRALLVDERLVVLEAGAVAREARHAVAAGAAVLVPSGYPTSDFRSV